LLKKVILDQTGGTNPQRAMHASQALLLGRTVRKKGRWVNCVAYCVENELGRKEHFLMVVKEDYPIASTELNVGRNKR